MTLERGLDDESSIHYEYGAPSGVTGAQTTGHGPLDDVERAVLEFEKLHWKYAAVKETQVLERWGWSMTRYYQVVNALLDRPEAEAAEPMLVRRLRRLREARKKQRTWGSRA
jgi:hypothetical protein